MNYKSKYLLKLVFCIMIAVIAITGCDDDIVAPELDPIVTIDSISTVSGTIDVTEIGGAGLTVLTAWNDSAIANVDSNGVFDASVSSYNSQLMFVVDENDNLRALGLSIPNSGEALSLDVTSTVISLLMLTPGIITHDSESSKNQITALKQLPDFNNMVSLLKDRMKLESLETILASSTFINLYENTVNAWITSHESDNIEKKGLVPLRTTSLNNKGFIITKPDLLYGNIELELANYAWRYVKVLKQRINIDNQPIGEPEIVDLSMKGGQKVSMGTLYTSQIGDPTIKQELIVIGSEECSSTNPIVASYEYWIFGPGYIPPDIIIPSYISKDYGQSTLNTVLTYLLEPILNIIIGQLNNETISKKQIKDLYENGKVTASLLSLTSAIEAEDFAKTKKELASLVHTVIKWIVDNVKETSTSVRTVNASKLFLKFFKGLGVIIEGTNLAVALNDWGNNSWAYKITVKPDDIISDVKFLPEFNNNIIKLNRGESLVLNAHAYNDLGQSIDLPEDLLLWFYENSEFVEFVDGDNPNEIIINAKKGGSSSISIQEDNWCNSDSYSIEINGVKSLKVTPSDILNIRVGKDQLLKVEALDIKGHKLTEIDPSFFEWSIQDNSIVNLGWLQGIAVPMKAVKEGSTIITVTETLSSKTAKIIVTVKEENIIESLRINPSGNLSLFAGDKLNISVDALDENKSVVSVDPSLFEWSVLDASIVTLNSSVGSQLEITGLSLGETQITVTEKTSGKSISTNVTIKAQALGGGSWDWYVNDSKDNSTLYIYSDNTMRWQYNVVSHSGAYVVNGNQIEFDKIQVYLGNTYYLLDCVGTINATVDTISGTCTSPATGDYIGTFKAIRR